MEENFIDYTKEIEALKTISKKLILVTTKDREIRRNVKKVLNSYKEDLKFEIKKKFITETDWDFLDEMEMTIIDYMIIWYKFSLESSQREIFALNVRQDVLMIIKITILYRARVAWIFGSIGNGIKLIVSIV